MTSAAEHYSSAFKPLTLVSTDCHVGPSLRVQLRQYCDPQYLDDYDDYVRNIDEFEVDLAGTASDQLEGVHAELAEMAHPGADTIVADREVLPDSFHEAQRRSSTCPGLQDPHARCRDLDSDGVAGEVIYNGGQNGEGMPFMYSGFNANLQTAVKDRMDIHRQWQRANVSQPLESPLSLVGMHIYNRWLADFVSVEPERHVGLMQIPIWDIDATIEELRWGREHGLRGINFPAPRQSLTPYNDPVYEPLWSAIEDLDLPLSSHAGSGDLALGMSGPAGYSLLRMEAPWLGRRAVWQLIFSGVFERHPGLKLVLAEHATMWVPQTLEDLDSVYRYQLSTDVRKCIPELPSTYWQRHCYLAASFTARFEVEQRHSVGVDKIMWGSDYPHVEGAWPNTMASLRTSFHDIPEEDARRMLGGNAINVYAFDADALDKIARRIGPSLEALDEPAGELPEWRGFAFRTNGFCS